MSHQDLIEPQVIINQAQCERNITKIAALANRDRVRLRPHFKTHQSAEIGEWFRKFGVSSCAVSNMKMAEFFVNAGWDDVLLALPALYSPSALGVYDQMAARCRLGLIGDSVELIFGLKGLSYSVDFWIDVDAGYGRSGVRWDDTKMLEKLVHSAQHNKSLKLRGFLVHSGESYGCQGVESIRTLAEMVKTRLSSMMDQLGELATELEISYGDTPTCATECDMKNYHEIRPGNFIFFDLMQFQIGSCSLEEIALKVACPVLGVYPDRNEIVIHGGAVHLSKEKLRDGSYGHVYKEGELLGKIVRLSQEHGVVKLENSIQCSLGDSVEVLPVHSCLVIDAMS